MAYKDVTPPAGGKISIAAGRLVVPDNPIIPFIRGDGTGPDIWASSVRVLDASVEKAYGGKRKISWFEVFAGEESFKRFNNWLPDDTVEAFREYIVGIKGPLTTPVGGGIRSLNVALRQMLDLYVCLRPVQWFAGVPSPVKRPELVDMVIFRENTEDIYAGIEFAGRHARGPEGPGLHRQGVPEVLREDPLRHRRRRPRRSGPRSAPRASPATSRSASASSPSATPGSVRLIHSAIAYAIRNKRKSVTLVHKGNIMKFTEGAFRDWGYKVAKEFYGAVEIDGGPWCKIPEGKPGAGIVIKDSIADITLQQVLTRPTDFDVIATLNLNGDYLSDALAAQVGGIGIAPGGNINYISGPRHLRGDPRHRPEVRQQGRGEPGLGRPLGRDDAALHGLDRGGRPDPQGAERRHRRQAGHLRLRPPDGGGDRDQVLRLRRRDHRPHVSAQAGLSLPDEAEEPDEEERPDDSEDEPPDEAVGHDPEQPEAEAAEERARRSRR